jgi:type VI secretion system protein ImpK
LADLFSDVFIVAMQIQQAREGGSADALRIRFQQLFDEAERKGQALGKTADALQQARYAVAAFVDEMILTSQWPHRDGWSARPLQYEFFREHVAGEEFFNRLDAMRRGGGDPDLLALYFLCLILGFEGKYRLHGGEKLKALVAELAQDLRAAQANSAPLSPHGKRPDELIEAVKRGLPSWVVVVASAAVVFFFYVALSFVIRHDVLGTIADLEQLARGGP